MNRYRRFLFTHPTARAVTVIARTFTEAFRKLKRTHEAYFHPDGWKAQLQAK